MSTGIPMPSEEVVSKLAGIAISAEDLLASDHPTQKAAVGVQTMKDTRRRTAERIMVLLADPDVRSYLKDVRSRI